MTSKNTVIYTSGVPPPRCACLQAPGSTILMFSERVAIRGPRQQWCATPTMKTVEAVCALPEEDWRFLLLGMARSVE